MFLSPNIPQLFIVLGIYNFGCARQGHLHNSHFLLKRLHYLKVNEKKPTEVLTHNSIDNVDRIVDFSVTGYSDYKNPSNA